MFSLVDLFEEKENGVDEWEERHGYEELHSVRVREYVKLHFAVSTSI